MANSPFQSNPAFAKLGEDSRKAVTQAFDAMSNWRSELAQMGEKNSNAVFDKMSEAAKSLGWPTELVEMSRKQVQTASKMQVQVMDQIMDTWEKQITNPGAGLQMPSMPNMSSMFPGMPNMTSMFPGMQGGSMPGFDFGNTPMLPMQLWMQAAEMWQKSWQQAVSSWMEAQQNMMKQAGTPPKTGR